ncbi:ATP-binding cassette domain-containing protein [Bacillus carboniphilus]|uniref:ATP-binding cassette domain-containing protein n=1 Tax=Bacillus carboniphilus TaxID=86663 RepID=A0ABP3FTK0_9BACI
MLNVYNVAFAYDKKPVVQDISFSVNAGEFIGILGPNGSGKTTLLKLISKGLPLHAGEVRINDQSIHTYSSVELAKVMAVLPQSTETSFSYSVRETIELGRYPFQKGLFPQWSKEDEEAVRQAILATSVESFQEKELNSLSGGEKQRVFLAQALAQEPSLFLLDEPTNHLDLAHQKGLMDLLKKWSVEKNLTVLSVFHDLNLASLYCDRLILMDQGEIISLGTPWEVLEEHRIQHVYKTNIKKQPHTSFPRPQVTLIPNYELGTNVRLSREHFMCTMESVIYQSPIPLKTISSAVFNSGMGWYSTFLNRKVTPDYDCDDSQNEMRDFIQQKGLNVTDTVAMMTAVHMEDVVIKEWNDKGEDFSFLVMVTAGVGNAIDVSRSYQNDRKEIPGTINVWVLVNGDLAEEAFVQAIMTATEAKSKALFDLEIHDSFSKTQATGTPTDSMLIASTQKGTPLAYAGPVTSLGKGIGKTVYDATREAIEKYIKRKEHGNPI